MIDFILQYQAYKSRANDHQWPYLVMIQLH